MRSSRLERLITIGELPEGKQPVWENKSLVICQGLPLKGFGNPRESDIL